VAVAALKQVRAVVRYGVVLVAGVIAGGRAVSAFQALQQWRIWRERDPSAADAYLTFAEVDATIAVVSLVFALVVWWILGEPSGSPPQGTAT
jgi:hypothetical protein